MTRGNIQTLILGWLDDLNAGYFTATQVNTWINNAQSECQKKLLQANSTYYTQTVQTPTVTQQYDYVLPTDYLVLHRLEVVLSGTGVNEIKRRLSPITLNQQELLPSQPGAPSCYAMKKDRFSVFPAPDVATYYLRLYYSPRVADMSLDADIPDVPTQFQEYIAVLAAIDGYIKDDRVPTNLLEKKRFYEELMMSMADERTMDESRTVNMTSDDGFGSLF